MLSMKKLLLFLLMAALMGASLQAQNIIDTWGMTTGVDAALWYDISGHDSTIIAGGDKTTGRSALTDIGFPFTLGGTTHTLFSTNINGTIRLGSTRITVSGNYNQPLGWQHNNGPKIEPFGAQGRFDNTCYTRMALLGDSGSRVLVVETRLKDYNSNGDSVYLSFQVQLFEAGGLRIVYGNSDYGALLSTMQNGVVAAIGANRDIIFINFATQSAERFDAADGNCTLTNSVFPVNGRWYMFVPDSNYCPYPQITTDVTGSAGIILHDTAGIVDKRVMLPALGVDTIWPKEDSVLIVAVPMNPVTTYELSVQGVCDNGHISYRKRDFSFTTDCGEVFYLPWDANFSRGAAAACWDVSQATNNTLKWKRSGSDMMCGMTTMRTYNEWLISPTINMPDEDGVMPLQCEYKAIELDSVAPLVELRLAPCAADGTVDSNDWTTILTLDSIYSDYTTVRVPLEAWRGQRIKIAFVRIGTGGNRCYVRNLTLSIEQVPVIALETPVKIYGEDTSVCIGRMETGAVNGAMWMWHSSLLDTTWIHTPQSANDTLRLVYPIGGLDRITLVVSNAYGADTATAEVYVVNCGTAAVLPWMENKNFEYGIECWYNPRWAGNWEYGNDSNGISAPSYQFCAIVSKPIYIPADTNEKVRLFWKIAQDGLPFNHTFSVQVTTDSNYNNAPSYIYIYSDSDQHPRLPNYETRSVDLSQFAGSTIRIAFRKTGQTASTSRLYILGTEIRSAKVPVIGRINVASEIYTDNAGDLYAVAVLDEGTRNGMTYTWYSSLTGTTYTTTNDTVQLQYNIGGMDTLRLIVENAYGADTAYAVVRVHDCSFVGLPFNEPFQNDNTLGCWRTWSFSNLSVSMCWQLDESYGTMSTIGYCHTHEEWLITPKIAIPANTDGINLHVRMRGASGSSQLFVVASTTGVQSRASFNDTLFDSRGVLTTWYKNFDIPMDEYAGQNVYIAFVDNGSCGVGIDNVSVSVDYQPQASITSLTPISIVGDTSIFKVTSNNCVSTGISYTWHSSLMDSTVTNVTDSLVLVYTVGGIDTVMYIVSNAYGADTAIVIVTVHDCPARPVPYIEDFDDEEATTEWETAGSMPSCWIIKTSDASATTLPHIVSSYQYISAVTNNALLMMAGDPSQHGVCEMEMVAMPYFNEPLTNLQLAFDYCFESSRCVLEVGYYNSYRDVFTVVDTVTPHTGSYIRDTVSFLGVTANNVHIALRWSYSTSYWGVAIDNIEVLDTPVPQISIESPSIAYVYDTVDLTAHLLHGDTTGLTYSWQSTMVDNGVAQMVATDSVLHVLYTVPGTDTIKLTTVNAYGSRIDWVYVQVSDCNRRAIPYFDDFESVPVAVVDNLYTPHEPGHLPECWESRWTGHEFLSPRGYGLTYYLDGTRVDTKVLVLEAGTNNNSSTVTYAVLPGFEYDINELSVAFDYFLLRYLEPQYNGIFSVGYMVDTVFTPVRNLTFFEHLPFRRDTIRFHDVTIPNARIALRYQFTMFAENYAAIDNLEVFRDTTPVLPPVPDTVWRTVTLTCDSTMGVTDGGGIYPDSSMVTLSATALDGYEFTSWDDGDSSNPRLVMVVSDTSFVAIFNAVEDTTPIPVPDTVWRTVTISTDSPGACETYGTGRYPDSSIVEIGYMVIDTITVGGRWQFLGWDDSVTETPRNILVTSDTTIVALFVWIQDSVGIELVDETPFTIYPNPASTRVVVVTKETGTVTLTDVSGRTVLAQASTQSNGRAIVIDISSLPHGVYFVRLDGSGIVKKLIVR